MAHPRVKQMANFWGINTMAGRKTVKAMKIKNTPLARSRPKYMRDFPEGTVLVAELKLPGNSLTPLETTLKVPATFSLADLTAASMSNPDPPSSGDLEEAYEFQSASSDEPDRSRSVPELLGPPENQV